MKYAFSTASISNCTVSTFLIPLHQNSTQTNTTHVHVNEEWEWKLWKPQDRRRHQFTLEEIDSIFTVLYPHKRSTGSHKRKKRFSMPCIFMNEWPVVTRQAQELSHLPRVTKSTTASTFSSLGRILSLVTRYPKKVSSFLQSCHFSNRPADLSLPRTYSRSIRCCSKVDKVNTISSR